MQSVIKELALRLASNCTSEAKRKISRLVFKSALYIIFSRFEDILSIVFRYTYMRLVLGDVNLMVLFCSRHKFSRKHNTASTHEVQLFQRANK